MSRHDMNTERLQRLPKWAQQELALLQQRLAEATAELRRVAGAEPTRVQVDPDRLHGNDTGYNAKDDAIVRFRLGDDWQDYLDVNIEKHPTRGRRIIVRGGRLGISVNPESGNVVNIELRTN